MTSFVDLLAELPARIAVILKNTLTYLMVAQTALTFLIAGGYLEAFPKALEVVTIVLTGLGAVIVFIRKVTPVAVEGRGILPVD